MQIFFRHVRYVLILFSLVLTSALPILVRAQTSQDFLSQAIPLAQESQRESGVPASVTLAQALWETGHGKNPIGEANNYFGIKAAGATDENVTFGNIAEGWVWAWTKEWDGKRYIDSRQRFRKYRTMEDSFRDHGILLATTPRYADAMHALDDPREFVRRMAAAGYATSPTYATDLIAFMDARSLFQYDLPRDAAEFLGQSEYLTVHPGEILQIYFDLKNTGFGTWSPTADYYLGSANDERLSANARQELTQIVAPDRVQRWALTMIAPAKSGTYRTEWQLHHGSVSFGPQLYIIVNVQAQESLPLWQFGVALGAAALAGVGGMWFWLYRQKQKRLARLTGRRASL